MPGTQGISNTTDVTRRGVPKCIGTVALKYSSSYKMRNGSDLMVPSTVTVQPIDAAEWAHNVILQVPTLLSLT